MPWIRKWCCKFSVIRLQMAPESIMICTFCFKILAIVQNGLLSFVEIIKLYFFYFFLMEMGVEIIKLKA